MRDTFPLRRMLKPSEAEAYLGLAPGMLARLRRDGQGPAYIHSGSGSGQVRYDLGHLDVWAFYQDRELQPVTTAGLDEVAFTHGPPPPGEGWEPARLAPRPGGPSAWQRPRTRSTWRSARHLKALPDPDPDPPAAA